MSDDDSARLIRLMLFSLHVNDCSRIRCWFDFKTKYGGGGVIEIVPNHLKNEIETINECDGNAMQSGLIS